VAGGCPIAALGAETIRQTPEARAAMTRGLRQQIERFSRSASGVTPAEKRRAAIGSTAAMIGALILARLSDDPRLSDELLAETRAWLGDKGVAGNAPEAEATGREIAGATRTTSKVASNRKIR
jgi:TetR/AcrR family transcriptional repressor of nem operon